MKRIALSSILALIAIMALGVGPISSQANTAATSQGVSSSSDETTCIHMSKKKATQVFTHLDGMPSLRSEWSVSDDRTINHKGPTVKGYVPRDFWVLLEDNYGWEGYAVKAKNFQVHCEPDPGTWHTNLPSPTCPTTDEARYEQFGGRRENWQSGGYYPSGSKISFVVPFQGMVTAGGRVYTPGYLIRPSTGFSLYCWPANGQVPTGSH